MICLILFNLNEEEEKFINELLQIISRCGHIEKVSIEQRNFTDNPDIDEMIYLD